MLLCALALVSPALAAKPVDFERAAPDAAHARVSAPRAFNLVGLHWRGTATPDVELRVLRAGGWGRWQHLGVHGRGGSDPVWVGRARTVQYRLDRRVPGLRLHFVAVGKRHTRVRAAQTTTTGFPYVSREDWGASSCVPRAAPSYGTVKAVQVHHTVSLNDYTPEEAPQIVLAICRYHRNSNGWNDIGYNALVDKYGTLYEGRAGGLDQAVIGAHAQGFNSQTGGSRTSATTPRSAPARSRCPPRPRTSAGSSECTVSRCPGPSRSRAQEGRRAATQQAAGSRSSA